MSLKKFLEKNGADPSTGLPQGSTQEAIHIEMFTRLIFTLTYIQVWPTGLRRAPA